MSATRVSNLLLTGPPGCGKTTAIKRLLAALGSEPGSQPGPQPAVHGCLSEALRNAEGRRLGFAFVPIGGPRRVFAHRDLISAQRIGSYGVDVESINYVADTALAPRPEAALFVVDEIGPMEVLSPRFVRAVRLLLDDPRPMVATIALRGTGFIGEVKARADVELRHVDRATADALPAQIAAWIAGQRLAG